jgi:hypothetical protein
MTNTAGTEACRYKTGDFEDTPCPFVTFLFFCSIPIRVLNDPIQIAPLGNADLR